MVDDNRFDNFIHMCLARHLVLYFWDRHQCGAKANGQVVRVHHVLIAVLGKTLKGSKKEVVKEQEGKKENMFNKNILYSENKIFIRRIK